MTTMVFVDADNVSADVIEQALAELRRRHGTLHVCRAYGDADCVQRLQALFKRLQIRPVVNLAAGKNSTDIALALDALALVLAQRPALVAIGSSDSDFAPLVSRIRELGCRVVGFGQQGKVGADTQALYDEFVVFEHGARSAAPKPAPARKATAKRAPRKAAPAPLPAPPLSPEAQAVLAALPELADGRTVELQLASPRLREAQLLSRSVSAAKKLGRHPDVFELLPAGKPTHVRLRARP